ncbi:hypothetical protein [Novosphingobium sp. 9U]|uniref:hypothetical protein n=1 Tax=Novosphingobium sp. 9U TaxID=2653158 RepID=UPI0012EF7106|nr:hypothetical protein [Novosphingobium sp. 9U]VWX51377.1 conserved exported hypothetical protein [Novosphingobium sp. 9U]
MKNKTGIATAIALGALSLTMASPAFAGKANDARKAIAAAQAKIETAHTLGAGRALPAESAQADEALKLAQNDFKHGEKDKAIEEATHAEALASTAIGLMQQDKDAALAAARDQQATTAAVAQDQIAQAQQQAADANARAQQAAQSAAEARNAAQLAAATPPAQVETTVTTQQATSAPRKTTHKVVRRKVSRPATSSTSGKVTTTTTVSTGTN